MLEIAVAIDNVSQTIISSHVCGGVSCSVSAARPQRVAGAASSSPCCAGTRPSRRNPRAWGCVSGFSGQIRRAGCWSWGSGALGGGRQNTSLALRVGTGRPDRLGNVAKRVRADLGLRPGPAAPGLGLCPQPQRAHAAAELSSGASPPDPAVAPSSFGSEPTPRVLSPHPPPRCPPWDGL